MNQTDRERRNILVISAVILLAFFAACYSLGAAQNIRGHESAPLIYNAPTDALQPEWRLSREGRGDGAATKKIYTSR